jgi:hypothetical protein
VTPGGTLSNQKKACLSRSAGADSDDAAECVMVIPWHPTSAGESGPVSRSPGQDAHPMTISTRVARRTVTRHACAIFSICNLNRGHLVSLRVTLPVTSAGADCFMTTVTIKDKDAVSRNGITERKKRGLCRTLRPLWRRWPGCGADSDAERVTVSGHGHSPAGGDFRVNRQVRGHRQVTVRSSQRARMVTVTHVARILQLE